jgi:hypothetical protein
MIILHVIQYMVVVMVTYLIWIIGVLINYCVLPTLCPHTVVAYYH